MQTGLTDSDNEFKEVSFGNISISQPGDQILSLKPVMGNWNNVELFYVELVKI